jgi:hypothetical protein
MDKRNIYVSMLFIDYSSAYIIKFTDDTTVFGLITDNDETIGRRSETWPCGSRTTTSILT